MSTLKLLTQTVAAIASFILLASLLPIPQSVVAQSLKYPNAARSAVVDDYHGTSVPDPYRWLEQLESGPTRDWLKAEMRFTTNYLARMPSRAAIQRRLASLRDYARTEVPWQEANRIFYLRNTGLQPQSVLYMQTSINSPPQLVLDPNTISANGSIAVRDFAVSPDGRFLAYNTSRGGADEAETHIRRLANGRDLTDVVSGVINSVCWTQDGRGFFYPRRASQTKQFWYHLVGQSQREDRLILEWTRSVTWIYCMLSDNGRYALMVAESGEGNEIYILDLQDPKHPNLLSSPIRLLPNHNGFHTPIDIVGDTFYLRTNLDAPNGRVIAIDLKDGAQAVPHNIVSQTADVIESATMAGNLIVLHYLVDVKSRLRLFTLAGAAAGEIALPGIGSVEWPVNGRASKPDVFYSVVSFLAPGTVYRYDVEKKISIAFRPSHIPFDSSAYETKQVFYPSKDGTLVPMFITAAKNLKLDGTNPTLFTAYGGYGASLPPNYHSDIPMWLEHGGVYAVANIRGGGEYGDRWHKAGMLDKKQNSFDDFIAGAEYLIAKGYTSQKKLAIYGHSNGGLLIGAAATQRPDLFAVAIPNAGHYDMLRYHRFTAGANWVSEYGSADNADQFRYLFKYSPLHRVRSGTCYPAMMILAADHDDRVVPSHSYKFTASLQQAQACDQPILLRVAVDSSHSYASPQAQLDEMTDMWAFVFERLRVTIAVQRRFDLRTGTLVEN